MRTILKSILGIVLATSVACTISCKNDPKQKSTPAAPQTAQQVEAPAFDADSAFAFTAAQVDFGPRVPNTRAHKACANYLINTLQRLGCTVLSQETTLMAYDGTALEARNIIGQINPESKKRVMLCAHWDSRPWADHDPNSKNRRTPILGANDGASGVGVLLEVARQLQSQPADIGVDIIFFDAEDYGTHDADESGDDSESSWCLGSQYWARVPHVENYNARYGILLDMVGGKGARFHQEYYSMKYARKVMNKVWEAAHHSGYGLLFPYEQGGSLIDDHIPVNEIARIPCIDIVGFYPETGFAPTWHTLDDNMENIDRNILKAVGQTLLQVIYNEK